jgi:hypothetical protein
MSKLARVGLAVVAATLWITSVATAGFVDADMSTVAMDETELYTAPGTKADETATVTIYCRTAQGLPLPGIPADDFVIDLGGGIGSLTAIDIETQADGSIRFEFTPDAGYCSENLELIVIVYTTQLTQVVTYSVRTVDFDDSGCIDGTDGAGFGLRWNNSDPDWSCADYDGNGIVEGTDGAIFGLYWGSGCP